MNLQLDISPEETQRMLTMREVVGIYLLLMIFQMIYPLKYTHQLKDLFEEIKRLKK